MVKISLGVKTHKKGAPNFAIRTSATYPSFGKKERIRGDRPKLYSLVAWELSVTVALTWANFDGADYTVPYRESLLVFLASHSIVGVTG